MYKNLLLLLSFFVFLLPQLALATTPVITSPVDGSTLSGSSETFHWDLGTTNVNSADIRLGSSLNSDDIFNSGFLDLNTNSIAVSGVPTDGSTVYLRYSYSDSSGWHQVYYTYTAAGASSSTTPVITSPVDGSTLSGSSETFHWDLGTTNVNSADIRLGSSLNSDDIFNSGFLDLNTNSIAVSGAPTDGSTVYLRYSYNDSSGWHQVFYTYTAAGATSSTTPVITSPVDGSTLLGSSETFHWDHGTTNVTSADIRLGSSLNADDIFNSGFLDLNANSIAVSGIPTDGSTVYLRYSYNDSSGWHQVFYTYTAASSQCDTSVDSDSDRLPDCYETNTNIYTNPQNTGTNPNNPDTDGDGIKDGDEVLGTTAGLNLPALGVNPLRKDILIEYDWFEDSVGSCSFHSHRPTQAIVDIISSGFNNAPVSNPDGSTGINIIHDFGQGGFTGGNHINDSDGVIAGNVFGSDFANYKTANFATNRHGYFHYILMPHQYNTNSFSSGYAEINGDDLIVSTICGLIDFNQNTTANNRAMAFTIMHELGHNLGLLHGGNSSIPNYKPNYNSVMNYRFQFPGVDSDASCNSLPDSIADYSHGNRLTLNENNLNETTGVCGNVAIDFNSNGLIESAIVADINNGDGFFDVLTDNNDWNNINFLGINDATGVPVGGIKDSISCQVVAPALQQ